MLNNGHAELHEIAVEISEKSPFAALDVARAEELQQRWQKLVKEAALSARDPLRERVQPVLDWLADSERRAAEERKHQKAIEALERALDAGADKDELEPS